MPALEMTQCFMLIQAEWYIGNMYVAVRNYAKSKFAADNGEQLRYIQF